MAAKKKKLIRATHRGALSIGESKIDCAVLEDGTRLIAERSMLRALGITSGGRQYQKKKESQGVVLPVYLGLDVLKPFISAELRKVSNSPIFFETGIGGNPGHGIKAEVLPQICDVWLKARDAGVLSPLKKRIAKNAEMLMRGLAHVGIIALVDEATGYQEVRDRLALQSILDKYLRTEYAKWAKCFPDEFYQEMFRLRKWEWKGMKENRPGVVGHFTNDIVYSRLAPGVLDELKKRNPVKETGGRNSKHHQWMTEDIGVPGLSRHLHAVIAVMKISTTWTQFHRSLTKAFPRLGDHIEMDLGDD